MTYAHDNVKLVAVPQKARDVFAFLHVLVRPVNIGQVFDADGPALQQIELGDATRRFMRRHARRFETVLFALHHSVVEAVWMVPNLASWGGKRKGKVRKKRKERQNNGDKKLDER